MPKRKAEKALFFTCHRCGTCCEKGGPALHQEDRDLIESGRIPLKHLFTIRPGEIVNDNVKGTLVRAETDIIKIKGKKGTWCCVFLDTTQKACTIYEDRPLECRTLSCREPEAMESLYTKNRLSRQDLLSSMEELWDLVQDHERRCSYDTVLKLSNPPWGRPDSDAQKQLDFILNYDTHIRRLVIEKGKMDSELLDFLFGRPLAAILQPLGQTSAF